MDLVLELAIQLGSILVAGFVFGLGFHLAKKLLKA